MPLQDFVKNVILSDFSVAYQPPATVGQFLFPSVPDCAMAGIYPKWGREAFRILKDERALSSEPILVQQAPTWGEYRTKEYSRKTAIDKRLTKAGVIGPSLLQGGTILVTTGHEMSKEKRIVDLVNNKNVMLQNSSPTSTDAWDTSTADILGQWQDAQEEISLAAMVAPNIAVIPLHVRNIIRKSSQIRAEFPTFNGLITDAMLAEILEVDQIVVPRVMYVTSPKGRTEVVAPLWGESVLLAYVDPNPGIMTISLGYQMINEPRTIYTRYNDDIKSWEIMVEADQAEELVAAQCAHLFSDVLTPPGS